MRPAVIAEDGTPMLAESQFAGSAGFLTERELAALRLMADGRRRREIVEKLGVSIRTYQTVCKALHGKLGAKNDVHAVAIGFRRGLLSIDRRSI